MDWIKTGRTVKANGESTVVYTARGAEWLTIESRKRAIPHANGIGSWMHTSYWVVVNGQDVKQRFSLKDAKQWAERLEYVDKVCHGVPAAPRNDMEDQDEIATPVCALARNDNGGSGDRKERRGNDA